MKQNYYRIVFYTAMVLMAVVVWFLPLHWVLKVIPDWILISIMLWVYCIDTAKEMPEDYESEKY